MRIVVTGAAGFVGGAVVRRALGRGHHVVALVRSTERARAALGDDAALTLTVGDVRDPREWEGALDGVLHFSTRSAEAYLACAARGGIRDRALAPAHYCLSRQVAVPLTAAGAAAVLIAARPDEAALLELVGPA